MKLIVGLGNPGKKYEKTRHNIGWMILNEIINNEKRIMNNLEWHESKKAKAQYLKIENNNHKFELLRPLTFMNNSGYSVAYAVKKHNLNLETDLIVVHDDKDIDLGKVKVQSGHGDAGHNGVKSIMQHLKTKNFIRIRVGVANNKLKYQDTATFVLKKFGLFEKKKLKEGIDMAVKEIMKLI